MKKQLQRLLTAGIAAAAAVSMILTGCGSKNDGSSEGTVETVSYTMVPVTSPDDNVTFTDWNDNPAIKYWLGQEWAGKKVEIEFHNPPAGVESDFYATLLATGDYKDIMFAGFLPDTPASLYDQGIALDLTDLIRENMPNYQAWLDAHPELEERLYSTVDGEKKLLTISAISDVPQTSWEALLYRRDWILAYGTNPETGAAFTGGWNEDKTAFEDDIVFPSGSTYPVYISDWEWMFDIFQTAIEDLGIEDGYAYQQVPAGFMGTGDVTSGFGGNAPGWYATREGEIRYGWTDDEANLRAYVECMKSWYEKGYMQQDFDEEDPNTLFFMIDQPGVMSGKVGMWHGLTAYIGNTLDNGEGYTAGICYAVAPQPINDIYGPESAQGVDPLYYYGAGSQINGQIIITDKAKDKDIVPLLTAIDWLYTQEGSELASFGVSDELQKEIQDPTLIEAGLANGCFSKSTTANGETQYDVAPALYGDTNGNYNFLRLEMGNFIWKNVNKGESDYYRQQLALTTLYPGFNDIAYLIQSLTSEEASEHALRATNASTYLAMEIPNFITGRAELNDANWDAVIEQLRAYGVDDSTKMLQSHQ